MPIVTVSVDLSDELADKVSALPEDARAKITSDALQAAVAASVRPKTWQEFKAKYPDGHPEGDACRRWVSDLEQSGVNVLVPEIADYELRRELIRLNNTTGAERLNVFVDREERLLPIETSALRDAARLWAEARNAGQPTAPPHALDGDVILAAQVLQFCSVYGLSLSDIVVASRKRAAYFSVCAVGNMAKHSGLINFSRSLAQIAFLWE